MLSQSILISSLWMICQLWSPRCVVGRKINPHLWNYYPVASLSSESDIYKVERGKRKPLLLLIARVWQVLYLLLNVGRLIVVDRSALRWRWCSCRVTCPPGRLYNVTSQCSRIKSALLPSSRMPCSKSTIYASKRIVIISIDLISCTLSFITVTISRNLTFWLFLFSATSWHPHPHRDKKRRNETQYVSLTMCRNGRLRLRVDQYGIAFKSWIGQFFFLPSRKLSSWLVLDTFPTSISLSFFRIALTNPNGFIYITRMCIKLARA